MQTARAHLRLKYVFLIILIKHTCEQRGRGRRCCSRTSSRSPSLLSIITTKYGRLHLPVNISLLQPNNEALSFCGWIWLAWWVLWGDRASSCCQLMSVTNREIGQWNDSGLLHPIVLLSNQQQVSVMINAECQLFQGRPILEIGSKRKRQCIWGDCCRGYMEKGGRKIWSIFPKGCQVNAQFC